MLKIIKKYKFSTKETRALRKALEKRGVKVYSEVNTGYKHVDLSMPDAKINIEVDGIQHLTNPHQILSDLDRGYYSHKEGYDTIHIPNEVIRLHLESIADALAEASRIREQDKNIHLYFE